MGAPFSEAEAQAGPEVDAEEPVAALLDWLIENARAGQRQFALGLWVLLRRAGVEVQDTGEGVIRDLLDPRLFASRTVHVPDHDLAATWVRIRGEGPRPRDPRRSTGPGADLSLPWRWDPLLAAVYQREAGCESPPPIALHASREHDRAWTWLVRTSPVLAGALSEVLRTVLYVQDEATESFATGAAHGAIFVTNCRSPSWAQVVEELAHQGGHVLFHAATVDVPALYGVGRDTPLSDLTGETGEKRTLHVALHGVVTEALMCAALEPALDAPPTADRHEALGRLAFALRRFQADLERLQEPTWFGDTGRALVRLLGRVFDGAWARRQAEVAALDLRGHPYAFDREVFAARNPGPQR